MDMKQQMFGVGEAAKMLGLSTWTLYQWSAKGRIASHKIGSRLMFSATELERVIRESERPRVKRASSLTHVRSSEQTQSNPRHEAA